MMNKLKLFICVILCLGVFFGGAAAAFAQSGDKILVAGGGKPLRQSEVDRMIEFYEWAFETSFTDDERERFAALSAEAFRQDAATSSKSTDSLLNTFAQVRAKDEATQQRAREIFNADFVKDLRASNDEASQLLLGVYERAQTGGNNSNAASNRNGNSSGAADSSEAVGNLSNLVGKWVWGRSGSSTYTTGGALMGSNGSRHTYQFAANGAVEYTGIMNVMTGGCNMQIFKSAKGRATLSGDRLTINWSPASFSRADLCSPSKDYKKTLPAETETFKINFKDSYGQRQLCLIGTDETCYSPTK